MSRVRKNYILFKTEPKKEPVLAGSFSSMKRAREAIREDSSMTAIHEKGEFTIELLDNGGNLWNEGKLIREYKICCVIEDIFIGG